MVPRPDNIIYLAGDNEFILAKDIMEDVKQHIPEKEMTIENICNYLKLPTPFGVLNLEKSIL